MTEARLALGRRGEAIAADHLVAKGYRIVERNARSRSGEIDLVCEDGEVLVFVEVRTRSGPGYGSGLESVDRRKRRQVTRAARAFLTRHGLLERVCRFDVVGVEFRDELASVEHVESAFDAEA